jgi:hypothetical protein
MVPSHCIGLANIAIDVAGGRPWFFERAGEADKAFAVCFLARRVQ